MSILDFMLLLLVSTVAAIIVVRFFKLPALIGYLAVGVLVAAVSKTLVPDTDGLKDFAEFGIVLLMFTIGLEFRLSQLIAMRRIVLGLGFLQVFITLIIVVGTTIFLKMEWRSALVIGCVLSMSSTAIVVKMLAEKSELASSHGQKIFGIALFQDLAVVPMLILVPALDLNAKELATSLLFAGVKTVLIFFVILRAGQPIMRHWFDLVARRKSQELFILNVLFISVGLSWTLHMFDLPMELGAFMAGLLIGETEYRHQVEEDIRPFRDVLMGLFFVILGMNLNLSVVFYKAPYVFMTTCAIMITKFLVITILTRFFDKDRSVAIRTGLWLCSAGEFGFVLLNIESSLQIIPADMTHILLASMLISMIIVPFLIQSSSKIVLYLSSTEWSNRTQQMTTIAAKSIAKKRHAILVGYGHHGQAVAHFLEKENIPYLAIDLNPDNVRNATNRGEHVVYGDATYREILIAAGLYRAQIVIVTLSTTQKTSTILANINSLNPHVPVVTRAKEVGAIAPLLQAGATEVVCESVETSLMICTHVLMLLGIPIARTLRTVRKARQENYIFLDGSHYSYASDVVTEEIQEKLLCMHTFMPSDAKLIGCTIGSFRFAEKHLQLKMIRRAGQRICNPEPGLTLDSDDILVIVGTNVALEELGNAGFVRI